MKLTVRIMSEHEHISKYWQATGVNFVVIQEEKTEKKTEIIKETYSLYEN